MKKKYTVRPTAQQLHQWYVVEWLSLRDIEKLMGASMPTIRGWLKERVVSMCCRGVQMSGTKWTGMGTF